jgi:hypothetical protein
LGTRCGSGGGVVGCSGGGVGVAVLVVDTNGR